MKCIMQEWLKDVLVAILYLSAVIVFWLLTGKSGFFILWSMLGFTCFLMSKNYRELFYTLTEFVCLAVMFMLIKRFILPWISEN